MSKAFRKGAEESIGQYVGQQQLILIEGVNILHVYSYKKLSKSLASFISQESKRSEAEYFGRNEANIKVIIPATVPIPSSLNSTTQQIIKPGDFIATKVISANSQVLKGIPLHHTTITNFYNEKNENVLNQLVN